MGELQTALRDGRAGADGLGVTGDLHGREGEFDAVAFLIIA